MVSTWQDSDNGWVPGSWGQPGHLQNPTNVTRLARAVSCEDKHHHPQIVYYQAGIGTGIGLWNHVVGGGTGMGLAENVREAYAFLASNYAEHDKLVPNDSIFLLGFSRGAFTARTLGGFICAMGILKKKAMAHFYALFEDWERAGDPAYEPMFFDNYFEHHHDVKKIKPDAKLAKSKKDRDVYLRHYFELLLELGLTQDVHINCIGVWDTVGALGIPVNPLLQRVFPGLPSFVRTYRWFDTRLDSDVKNAFQALALDERRFPFSPAVWERKPDCTSNLQQVWFPGSHSNVGGSYEDAGMADITLAWMMDQLAGNTMAHPEDFRAHEWIQFDEEYIKYWSDCSDQWYEKHKQEHYKGWARGKVYESNTFPQSLAGQETRVPGRYHGTDYESGKTDLKRLLANTNEQIHSSVRARIDMGARGVEPDWSQVFPHGLELRPLVVWLWRRMIGSGPRVYQPQIDGPLHGWKLVDGHSSHADPNWEINMSPVDSRPAGLKEVQWVYEGNGKATNQAAFKAMPEAKLGKYERRLLEKDQRMADKVEFTNNRWHWFRKDERRPAHGRTF
ncbi:hypothetical protein LTR36_003416 [Oleoguttula mirabilis]|uniref:T6SS Phospholipase effector Tle1-like catalytic domain-containing protein n=1 Tax=Oleoguttula mirabilis TaxID=1507867 RepID=A0AAV9JIJ2_9PEZI|nr:hypothetical protein LTR36_003416 [Oleoguttula mirabilis]